MQYIIMAYEGEMSLRGMNRKTFESVLKKTLKKRLTPFGQWKIYTAQSTFYIEPIDENATTNIQKAYKNVQKVFGLAAVSLSVVVEKDVAVIQQTAVSYLKNQLENAGTFRVLSRRADKTFPLDSMEISKEVGGYILEQYPHLKVDLKNPDLIVTVELRDYGAYIHGGKVPGAGGLPVMTSGRGLVMLSGGIDSPVAAWQMAKRGLALVAIHFESPPYTSPRAKAKVKTLAELLTPWTGPLPLYFVPFTKVQEYMRDATPFKECFTVLLRRSMLRIAHGIALKENCKTIITGESLSQVASQTVEAIGCTDEAQSLPILRPCIGMDKIEISHLAQQISTYETSILPYEDCCTIFTPPHPKTKPTLQEILQAEEQMPLLAELEAQTIKDTSFEFIK